MTPKCSVTLRRMKPLEHLPSLPECSSHGCRRYPRPRVRASRRSHCRAASSRSRKRSRPVLHRPNPRAGGPPGGQNPFAKLGAFCRVALTLKPASQSDIKAEVWLPSAGWNGKLQVVGNGGFAGTISYAAMANALAAGYAAASTDTGHTGPSSNTFANGDVLIDFAHRAIHETAVAAKAAVGGFFGTAAKFSYFNGCSTGGRQAVTAAQRYPDDFDGIVAGAPASHTSTQAFGQIWFYQALADPASAMPREKLTLLHDAVLNACDQTRWREGRRARESARLQVRSAGARVQTGKRPGIVPDAGAGRWCPPHLRWSLRIRGQDSTSLPDSSAEASWDGIRCLSVTRPTTSSTSYSRIPTGIRRR